MSLQVVVNEEEDPFMVIQRLRTQVADLQAELRCGTAWPDTDESPVACSRDGCAIHMMHGMLFRASLACLLCCKLSLKPPLVHFCESPPPQSPCTSMQATVQGRHPGLHSMQCLVLCGEHAGLHLPH